MKNNEEQSLLALAGKQRWTLINSWKQERCLHTCVENNNSWRNNGNLFIIDLGTTKEGLSNYWGEKKHKLSEYKVRSGGTWWEIKDTEKCINALKVNVWDRVRQSEKWTDLSKIWRIMRNMRAMGRATHKSQALAYTRPSRSSRSAQPRPSGNHRRSCQNHSLSSDNILKHTDTNGVSTFRQRVTQATLQ